MSIVVTGCSGFVGGELCKRLLKDGYEVIGIDKVFAPYELLSNNNFRFYKLDLSEFYGDLLLDIIGGKTVIHCAASVPITRVGMIGHIMNNVITTSQIISAGPSKIIYISTSAVYGDPNDIVIQGRKFDTIEEYGKSKLVAEDLLRNTLSTRNSTIIIRPRTIIGKCRFGMMDFLFPRIEKGKKVFLIGDGKNEFQLLSLNDLIEGILLAMDSKYSYAEYNLGASKFSTLGEDIQYLIDVTNSKSKIVHLPTWTRHILRILDKLNLSPMTKWHYDTIFHKFVFDTTVAENELGWKSKDSNIDMLMEAYTWYTNSKNELGSTPHTKGLTKKLLSWI